jgi:hypothetical protein
VLRQPGQVRSLGLAAGQALLLLLLLELQAQEGAGCGLRQGQAAR